MNPLLDFSGLPKFAGLLPTHVADAIPGLIAECRQTVTRVLADDVPATWDDFMRPLIDSGERLSRAWGMVGHLHSVNDVPEWRDAYNAMLPDVTSYYAEMGQNLALYAKTKALAASPQYAELSAVRRRIIDNDLRDFRLSGAELPEADKPRFLEIQEELSALAAKFSENLLDATNAHAEWVDAEADVAGLPADVVEAARLAAAADGRAGWKFTLQQPSYVPVMQYAANRDLRARMYRAYVTRAAEFTHGSSRAEWDNGPLIGRILSLRAEEAQLLGYGNFAEVSLAPKMAESPAQVIEFLRDMARRARPFGERDLAELRLFAARELSMSTLEAWDLPWASEKLKQARYAFSDDEVKQYFPEGAVLDGLFRVIERVFGVRLSAETCAAWDDDVRLFRIERAGRLIGRVFLDLHARATKRGGAWMDDAVTRRLTTGGMQPPVAYLVCNFPSAVGAREATFSHDDVITLFHEFGHGLHHLLTEVDELPVSGIHGVEWDAVELPSQFMENFCWEWDVLSGMTRHVDSGEPLPRSLFDRMLAAKNFQSGLQTLRQIEFGMFDMLLHAAPQPCVPLDVLEQVRNEVAVVLPPPWNRFANAFGHIFAGGYAAGYYSYKWAEVLSADAYAAFEEAATTGGSTLDAATGERFRREILAVGGSRPALDSFIAFRGRAPSADALLRHSGMAETA